jgi:CHAT domain-containing protein
MRSMELSFALAAALGAASPPSAGCELELTRARMVMDRTLPVRGRESLRADISVPRSHVVLVSATEAGVDVILGAEQSGSVIARADDPVRRTGVQHLLLSGPEPRNVSLTVSGTEHPESRGSVHLRAWALDSAAASGTCIGAVRRMAVAQAAYGRAQWELLEARDSPPPQSLATSYREAAATLAKLHTELAAATAQSALVARIELSLASLTYLNLQDWKAADRWAGRALESYTASGDDYGAARARAMQGAALLEYAVSIPATQAGSATPAAQRATLQRARSVLGEAARYHASQGQAYDQALQVNNIGLSYFYEGRFDEAIADFTRALAVYDRLRERPRQAQVLQNIALAEWGLGHLPRANQRFDEALALMRVEDAPKIYGQTLSNSGLARFAAGETDEALRRHDRAVKVLHSIQATREESQSLYGIGIAYAALGKLEMADSFLSRALAVRTPALDARGRVATLRALASVREASGNTEVAQQLRAEALTLATAPSTRARIAAQLAVGDAQAGRLEAGMARVEELLAVRPALDPLSIAIVRAARARLRLAGGNATGALEDLRDALPVLQQFSDTAAEFDASLDVVRAHRARNDTAQALAAAEKPLSLVEELRAQTRNPELRATRMQPLRPAYDVKVALLLEQLRTAQSQHHAAHTREIVLFTEGARGRTLRELAGQDFAATPRGEKAQLLGRREALYRNLASHRYLLESRQDGAGAEDARAQRLLREIAELRREVDSTNTRLAVLSAAEKVPEAAISPLLDDATAIPDGTAVIGYWIGEETALAWVLSRKALSVVPLDSSRAIESAARALHESHRNFGNITESVRREQLGAVSTLVLAPLREALRDMRTLVVIPDGALHYVPFAALRDPDADRYLVERRDVAIAPGLRWLRPVAPASGDVARGKVLLVADPVYERDDERFRIPAAKASSPWDTLLLRGGFNPERLRRLPASGREIESIRAMLDGSDVRMLTGFGASRSAFLGEPLESFRIIHVAAHGHTDASVPQLSALYLSTLDRAGERLDSAVLAADLATRRFDADLIVFSGCDTALGTALVGEGLLGLQYVTIARGARSVIASLWEVPDRVTADLMIGLYRSMSLERSSAARALAAAQRQLITKGLRDAALWSAFNVTIAELPR